MTFEISITRQKDIEALNDLLEKFNNHYKLDVTIDFLARHIVTEYARHGRLASIEMMKEMQS
jgi:hypothetical protein